MALRELSSTLCRLTIRDARPLAATKSWTSQRYASEEVHKPKEGLEADLQDLESQSSFTAAEISPVEAQKFNPLKRAARRKTELPSSRYQYRSPRYARGPLHPHQPPPRSDPSSREFIPGPFSHTRLEQTYQATIAPDLMVLTYAHKQPGQPGAPKSDRLRTWDDSSPYHKGRPKRGPRGPGEVLRVVEQDIQWRNIPKIERVTVHSMIKHAVEDSAHLHVAGIMLQAITGVRPVVHRAKHSVAQFNIRVSQPIALTCTLRGDQAYEFVDKVINLVLPKIKDWPGVQGSTGDGSGNLSFGFDREGAILFPEVEVNYDSYPPKMIPGFHVTIHTSATSDRHARLLLGGLGLPFTGKLVD